MISAMLVAMHLAVTVAVPPDLITPATATSTAAEADALWHSAGLDIEWSIGDRPGWTPDGPMLWVVFTDRCNGGRASEVPIASILFINGEPTRRIVVCRPAAIVVVDRASPENRLLPPRLHDALAARVMGRAIAHEIGHYLYGPGHTATGLMRAEHSATDFCAGDSTGFAILPPAHVARALPTR